MFWLNDLQVTVTLVSLEESEIASSKCTQYQKPLVTEAIVLETIDFSLFATLQIWLINEEPQSCLLSVGLVSCFSLPPLALAYFKPSPCIGTEFLSFSLFFLSNLSFIFETPSVISK